MYLIKIFFNKKKLWNYLACFILIASNLNSLPALAATNGAVQVVRSSATADQAREVLLVSAPIHYDIFELDNPARLVIDLKGAQLSPHFNKQGALNALVKSVRLSTQPGLLRLVFDLKFPVRYTSFVSSTGANARIVIDMARGALPKPAFSKTNNTPAVVKVIPSPIYQETSFAGNRDIVIVIDPGHGGKDTGAIGQRHSYEKHDVLAISKRLQALINRQKGFKAVLTRTRDYYLTLRQRLDLARKYKADMFVAIHADAFRNHQAHGASVYALSQRGATSEAARWLAERENESELMGGVELNDKDSMLKSVLLNLSQTATIQAGLTIGYQLLISMGKIGSLHHRKVEQAAFVVLKSPDIPSVLVECGFISNWQEEAKLNDPVYQQKIANAVMQGIINYFRMAPPRGTWLASQKQQP